MKFVPHGIGKDRQTVTYQTVKDYIIQLVQKSFRNGKDVADSWQNRAEDQIQEIRRRWRLLPARLWDYGMVHLTKLMNFTARGKNGRTGHEEVTGETPDISEYVDFDFYDWVWYWDTPDKDNSPKIWEMARSIP
jgi:hypothetical protein